MSVPKGTYRTLALCLYLMHSISCSTHQKEDEMEPVIGVWLTNIDSELMFSEENIVAGIKRISDLGFNTIYPVVWNDGYTLHPSQKMIEYFGAEFEQDTVFKVLGIDPLSLIIREARRNNLRVVPWFEFGFSSSYNQDGGHIISKYPHWAAKDSAGNLLKKNNFDWMNAIHPEVQQFITELVLEVVKNYDIDGIQGDDRLPAMPSEGGYSDFTRNLFAQEMGKEVPNSPYEEEFLNWKSDKLTDYASSLYRSVKEVNDQLTISFAPSIYPWSKEQYLQDWPAWIEAGAVDELIPQAYRWEIERYKSTIDETLEFFENSDGNENVVWYPGLIIKAGSRYNGFDYVDEAVRYNRSKGIDGEVYFFYEGLFEQNEHLGDSLSKYYYGK